MNSTTVFHQSPQLDPRPDLNCDSNLWQCVLQVALQADPYKDTPKSIFGLLHGLRCGGATLELSEQGKLRLNYGVLIDGGIWSNRELRSIWLLPAATRIKQVFHLVEQQLPGTFSQTALLPTAVGL